MIVVTNAGPLMAFAKLGLLHLLDRLYGTVLIPGAVYDEVRIIFDSIIERNDIWIAEGLCRSIFDGLKNRN